MSGKGIRVRMRLSDVEKFKDSVKVGDKFLRECLTGEVIGERKSVPKFEAVEVVKKYRNFAQVKSTSTAAGPIKTMTYMEMFMQRKGKDDEQIQSKK